MNEYLDGKKLYGDDFSYENIKKWYLEEEEGYSALNTSNVTSGYEYHELNKLYGYKYLPSGVIGKTIGFGSALGDEFKPIEGLLRKVFILEPSEKLHGDVNDLYDVVYIKPDILGELDFESNSIDLITCFGVLHHIPNVSYVLSEMYRVLAKGGYCLIREPVISMGDWEKLRPGLTKNERGVPVRLFDEMLSKAGFSVVKKSGIISPLTMKVARLFFNKKPFNSKFFTMLDRFFSFIFPSQSVYHRTKYLEKLSPMAVYYVLQK